MSDRIYLIDSSVIINMHRDFRIERFPGVWDRIGELLESGRMFVHRQVAEELKAKGTGACLAWKNNLPSHCLIEMDGPQAAIIADIQDDYPYLRHYYLQPENKMKADLFLVATARIKGWWVVTDEGGREWKIPDICNRYGVDSFDKWGLMEYENWTFT